MTTLWIIALLALTAAAQELQENASLPVFYPATVLEGDSETCASSEEREMARAQIGEDVHEILQGVIHTPGLSSCGGTPGWSLVAYLNMTNSSHQCPGEMEEVTLSGIRLCGRSPDVIESCASATYPTNDQQYTQVCGRITGYHFGDTTAFGWYTVSTENNEMLTIDTWYVDGVTVTHGAPGNREHVWTFANGISETAPNRDACPCAPNAAGYTIPPFIGQDYFCESATASGGGGFFTEPLWDGEGCTVEGNTCCEFNDPPYFTKQLNTTTSNGLEVRACGHDSRSNSGGSADTLIGAIELYVQ